MLSNSSMMFEIKAATFYRMTGYLAPGKDWPAAAGSSPKSDGNVRQALWNFWNRQFGDCVEGVLKVIDDMELVS